MSVLTIAIVALIYIGCVDCQMQVVKDMNDTIVAAYKCVKSSTNNVVGEICMAHIQTGQNGVGKSVIRNLRFPQVLLL